MLRTAFFSAVFLATVGAMQPTTTTVPLENGARIVLVHPSSWSASVDGPSIGPTATFEGKGKADFQVRITAIPRANGKPSDQGELEQMVRAQGEKLLSSAKQTEVTLVRVDGREAKGFLYHFTDRNPEKGPGDYREMNQGGVVLGPYLLSFTALTHSGDQATVTDAIKVLTDATYQEASH